MHPDNTENPYLSPETAGEVHDESPSPYSDRSVGLVIFGSLQLLIAALFSLMIVFLLFALVMERALAPISNQRAFVPAFLTYLFAATLFATLGIGSILARRWARALTLVLAWFWLIMGLLATGFFAFFMGNFTSVMAGQPNLPPQMVLTMQLVMGAVLGCLYLLLPGAFVLFYRSPHVKATCERRNRAECWTDRCPLPVLGLSTIMAMTTFWMLCFPLYGGAIPAFGILLRGLPGALVCVGILVATGWLAYGTYKLRKGAWWGCVVLAVLSGSSALVTFLNVDMMTFYETTGLAPEQLDMMRRIYPYQTTSIVVMSSMSLLVMLVYLLWIKRYFFTGASPKVAPSDSETSA